MASQVNQLVYSLGLIISGKGDTNGDLVNGEELTVREISRSFGELFEQVESRTFGHFDPSTLINYGCYGFYFSERPQVCV